MNYEYIIIAIVFILSLLYLWHRVKSVFSRKGGACNKGCGCNSSKHHMK